MEKEKMYENVIWSMIESQIENEKDRMILNNLTDNFNEEEMDIIGQISQFYFEKGVKQGIELMEYLK
ncbi:hypothetical protein K5V21_18940 [Clostridium sardiniense]|uniref:Phage protein n=1 Tax=Clostridium sardiniense TaxID=29369 RepID=A0ABS7L326_CLOSR|nr:hypothetical protein [Clostridium sardiniense]MBY0757478.1 hypothetical protein [Clostridium sardiniense]MDQ0462235.1 hypothetical protein [Clostridium sardiniense]